MNSVETAREPSTWLVGIDGSAGAERALRWCVDSISGRAAHVHIVKAWHQPVVAGVEYGVQDFTREPDVAYEGLDHLAAELARLDVTVAADVVFGGASSVLLTASQDAALLVVGNRGHGGFERLLLGSVSQQCATHARIPTVVVPVETSAGAPPRRVVVGIDGSPASAAALDWALKFVSEDAIVVAVGVWNPSTWTADADDPFAEHREQRWIAEVEAVIEAAEASATVSVTVERDHRRGSPAARLLDSTAEADLLVVGERGRSGFSAAVLGSVTTAVLHHAECPVAVIPATGSGSDATTH